ncbi:MAG: UbiA family prenyltransferase [Geminicoccaceae bacterium]
MREEVLPAPADSVSTRPPATLVDYLSIARPDHWPKHVFIIPGIALAYVLSPNAGTLNLVTVVLGFIVAMAIASANYVINEWLDAEFDAHHPTKSRRPAVAKQMSATMVYAWYTVLALLGLAVAALISKTYLLLAFAFLASGWIYNIRPLRTKDQPYLDVASEAINNPIRLMLGWAMVDPSTLPPSSLLIAYWAGGAFLMATKRLAEYRHVAAKHGVEVLHLYRRSFRYYTEKRLLIYVFLCAQLAAFFIAVFLIKYRVEYILTLPLFAILFTIYLQMGLKDASNAQTPEKLFRERALMITVLILVSLLVLLTVVDLPGLSWLADPHYMTIGG